MEDRSDGDSTTLELESARRLRLIGPGKGVST